MLIKLVVFYTLPLMTDQLMYFKTFQGLFGMNMKVYNKDQEDAAEEVGRRMAEREEQGSTEWVRSPDGKLRRKKIDDPWDS
jgi:hypothetical protein